jgi:hypothetical protein
MTGLAQRQVDFLLLELATLGLLQPGDEFFLLVRKLWSLAFGRPNPLSSWLLVNLVVPGK